MAAVYVNILYELEENLKIQAHGGDASERAPSWWCLFFGLGSLGFRLTLRLYLPRTRVRSSVHVSKVCVCVLPGMLHLVPASDWPVCALPVMDSVRRRLCICVCARVCLLLCGSISLYLNVLSFLWVSFSVFSVLRFFIRRLARQPSPCKRGLIYNTYRK